MAVVVYARVYRKKATATAMAVKWPMATVSEPAAPVAPVCCAAALPSVTLASGMGVGASPEELAFAGLAATLEVGDAEEDDEASDTGEGDTTAATGLVGRALTSPSEFAFAMAATHLVTSLLCCRK